MPAPQKRRKLGSPHFLLAAFGGHLRPGGICGSLTGHLAGSLSPAFLCLTEERREDGQMRISLGVLLKSASLWRAQPAAMGERPGTRSGLRQQAPLPAALAPCVLSTESPLSPTPRGGWGRGQNPLWTPPASSPPRCVGALRFVSRITSVANAAGRGGGGEHPVWTPPARKPQTTPACDDAPHRRSIPSAIRRAIKESGQGVVKEAAKESDR